MKKSIKTVISFMLITLLVLSFSSCSIFASMRENALNASQTTIYATPEEDAIITEFNELLVASMNNATEIKESTSYSAGNPDIYKDGEEAGTLDAAAKQLKTFIMSAKPGSTSTVLEKDAQSLLNQIDEASVLKFDYSRNMQDVAVTDEEGNEVTNEDGSVVTESKIKDNVLHFTFNFFADEVVASEEPVTDENGEAVETTTTIYAEDATIESIFGTLKDKEAVLQNFDVIKDYIVVTDYEIAYENCHISADADLEEGTVSFVNFQKNMKVTAKAECVGALAEYGEVEIVFTLTLNTNYEFSYAEAAEEAPEADTEAAADETTAAETAADEETTAEEAVAEETTAEEAITEEETAAEETTVA